MKWTRTFLDIHEALDAGVELWRGVLCVFDRDGYKYRKNKIQNHQILLHLVDFIFPILYWFFWLLVANLEDVYMSLEPARGLNKNNKKLKMIILKDYKFIKKDQNLMIWNYFGARKFIFGYFCAIPFFIGMSFSKKWKKENLVKNGMTKNKPKINFRSPK